MPLHIYCVYVCALHPHTRTHTVSDLCATGDHDCEQVCISSPGSFKCACKDGFTLMDDGRSCSGECVNVCVWRHLSKCDHCCTTFNMPCVCVRVCHCQLAATLRQTWCSWSMALRAFVLRTLSWSRSGSTRSSTNWMFLTARLTLDWCSTPAQSNRYVSVFSPHGHQSNPLLLSLINVLPLSSHRSFPWAATTTRKTWRTLWRRWLTWRGEPWPVRPSAIC